MTDVIDRIEKSILDLNAAVASLDDTVTTEIVQINAKLEELRGLATNSNMTPEQTSRLAAIADEMEASTSTIGGEVAKVKGIIPDVAPPPEIVPTPNPTPNTPPVSGSSGSIFGGTASTPPADGGSGTPITPPSTPAPSPSAPLGGSDLGSPSGKGE